MFDKHHLLKHGVSGHGVVTSHKEIAHDQYGGELDYSMHVRVRFEDGTETEIVHRWPIGTRSAAFASATGCRSDTTL